MDEREALQRIRVGGWLRQTRFRARKYGCTIDLSLEDVLNAIKGGKCYLCGIDTEIPDLAFSISDKAPCVQANLVVCCPDCRINRKNKNPIELYKAGKITREKLQSILVELSRRKGGSILKEHLRQIIL